MTGIGKYACRLVPFEVRAEEAVRTKCSDVIGVLEVEPVLVEKTDDSAGPGVLCEDAVAPLCGGVCPVGTTCQETPIAPVCVCVAGKGA